MNIEAINYSAFKTLPKRNRKEPLWVTLGATLFVLILSFGGMYVTKNGVSIEDVSGLVAIAVLLCLPAWLIWAAVKQDKSAKRHRDAFLQFKTDNQAIFSAQLYTELVPFFTPSAVASYRRSWRKSPVQPSREFLITGAIKGYDFELSNRFMSRGLGGTKYDPVSMMLEISLPRRYGGPRIICFRRPVDLVERSLRNFYPNRLGVKQINLRHDKFLIYAERPIQDELSEQLLLILSSIRDEFRWDVVELVDDKLFLFGERRIYFNEWNFKEAFEQADAVINVLAKAEGVV